MGYYSEYHLDNFYYIISSFYQSLKVLVPLKGREVKEKFIDVGLQSECRRVINRAMASWRSYIVVAASP